MKHKLRIIEFIMWLNLFLTVLAMMTGCSKRIVDRSKLKTDSTYSVKTDRLWSDTGSVNTYERYILLADTIGFNPKWTGGLALETFNPYFLKDAGTWPADAIVNYIKSLPDNVKLQYMPVYYEKFTNSKAGVSAASKSVTKSEVKKEVQEKKTERKTPLPWVAGLVFIILGIFLIVWVVPRKPKSL